VEVLVATVEVEVEVVGGAVGVVEGAHQDLELAGQVTTIIPVTIVTTNGHLLVICSKYPAETDGLPEIFVRSQYHKICKYFFTNGDHHMDIYLKGATGLVVTTLSNVLRLIFALLFLYGKRWFNLCQKSYCASQI